MGETLKLLATLKTIVNSVHLIVVLWLLLLLRYQRMLLGVTHSRSLIFDRGLLDHTSIVHNRGRLREDRVTVDRLLSAFLETIAASSGLRYH